jgi:hypothetical protein
MPPSVMSTLAPPGPTHYQATVIEAGSLGNRTHMCTDPPISGFRIYPGLTAYQAAGRNAKKRQARVGRSATPPGRPATAMDAAVAEAWGRLDVPDPLPVIEGLLAASAQIRGWTLVTRTTPSRSPPGPDEVQSRTPGSARVATRRWRLDDLAASGFDRRDHGPKLADQDGRHPVAVDGGVPGEQQERPDLGQLERDTGVRRSWSRDHGRPSGDAGRSSQPEREAQIFPLTDGRYGGIFSR